eukprot:GHVU01009267.1.p1 GENE.GHVU01009267.1~~GHVU01009267.1.p1  ORF type:complete len:123 (+),score=4.23 GHVU01009267.1:207-575(+)
MVVACRFRSVRPYGNFSCSPRSCFLQTSTLLTYVSRPHGSFPTNNQQVVFEKLAKTNTASSAPAPSASSKLGSRAKKTKRKAAQTQANQKGGSGRGQGPPKTKPTAKKGQNFRPGDKPEAKK